MNNSSAEEAKAAEAAQDAIPPQDDTLPSYTQAASVPQQIPDPARNGSLPSYEHATVNSPPVIPQTQYSETAEVDTTHTTTNNTTLPRDDPNNETLPDYAQAATDPPPRVPRAPRPRPSEPQAERSEAYMEALKAWAAERDMMRPRAYGEYFAKTHNLPEDEAHSTKKGTGTSPGTGRMSSFMKKLKGKGKDENAMEDAAKAEAGPSEPGPRPGDAVDVGRGSANDEDLGNNYW